MNIIKIINNEFNSNNYENIEKLSNAGNICSGGCNKSVDDIIKNKENLYYNNFEHYIIIIMCKKCKNDFKINLEYEDISKSESIMKSCNVCKNTTNNVHCNNNLLVNICEKCYENNSIKLFTAINHNHNYYISGRECIFIMDQVKELKIPTYFEDEVKKYFKTDNLINSYVDDLTRVDSKINNNILTWLPITYMRENDYGLLTVLLVNCDILNNGAVASLLMDGHGRIGIDIISNTIDEYKKEITKWNNDTVGRNLDFLFYIRLYKELSMDFG